jgi:hypothetical protein
MATWPECLLSPSSQKTENKLAINLRYRDGGPDRGNARLSARLLNEGGHRSELAKIHRTLKQMLSAIEERGHTRGMIERMRELGAREDVLKGLLAQEPADIPDIHPNVSGVYRRKVERLTEALNTPEDRNEAHCQGHMCSKAHGHEARLNAPAEAPQPDAGGPCSTSSLARRAAKVEFSRRGCSSGLALNSSVGGNSTLLLRLRPHLPRLHNTRADAFSCEPPQCCQA